MKSFCPKDEADADEPPADGPGGRNREIDFRGTRRSNDTHASTTNPNARLYRKSPGAGAKLCYMGHLLMENRNGLAVDAETTRVAGFAERLTAVAIRAPNGVPSPRRQRGRHTHPARWAANRQPPVALHDRRDWREIGRMVLADRISGQIGRQCRAQPVQVSGR